MNPNQPVVQTVTQQSIYSNLFSSFNVSLSTVSVICVCYRRQNPPADTWNVNWVKKSIVPKLTVVTVTPPLSAPAWKLQIFRWMHGLLGYSDICVLLIKKQMNPEEISADLWWTSDTDLASSLCCWFCWKPECCSEGSKTWHKVQFQHPNRFPLSQNWDPTNSFKTSPPCGSACRPACPQEGTVLVSVD